MSYAESKYLVYSTFETPHRTTGSPVCGSILIDSAITEEEVQQKIQMYQSRHDNFDKRYPSLSLNGKIIYIPNKKHWWK